MCVRERKREKEREREREREKENGLENLHRSGRSLAKATVANRKIGGLKLLNQTGLN